MSRRGRRKRNSKVALIIIGIIVFAAIVSAVGISLKDFIIAEIIIGVIVLAILVFAVVWNLPINKGKRGEKRVARILNKVAENNNGYVINDLIIPGNNESTSQIDHILFTRRGIFVVETKNYAGRLYGTVKQRNWTQVLAYGNTKNSMYNPLMQNQTHIYNLEKIIGNDVECHSFVVILRANLDYLEARDEVYTPRELKDTIREEVKNEIYKQDQIEEAYEKVNVYKLNPIVTNKEHVKNIKQQQKNIENNICPRCGGELILRKSKTGSQFYGCSNYPNCKFTKQK